MLNYFISIQDGAVVAKRVRLQSIISLLLHWWPANRILSGVEFDKKTASGVNASERKL